MELRKHPAQTFIEWPKPPGSESWEAREKQQMFRSPYSAVAELLLSAAVFPAIEFPSLPCFHRHHGEEGIQRYGGRCLPLLSQFEERRSAPEMGSSRPSGESLVVKRDELQEGDDGEQEMVALHIGLPIKPIGEGREGEGEEEGEEEDCCFMGEGRSEEGKKQEREDGKVKGKY